MKTEKVSYCLYWCVAKDACSFMKGVIYMFKDKKMREVVETHLHQVNTLLEHAKKEKLTEAINNYTSQKLALEHVLRDFDKI